MHERDEEFSAVPLRLTAKNRPLMSLQTFPVTGETRPNLLGFLRRSLGGSGRSYIPYIASAYTHRRLSVRCRLYGFFFPSLPLKIKIVYIVYYFHGFVNRVLSYFYGFFRKILEKPRLFCLRKGLPVRNAPNVLTNGTPNRICLPLFPIEYPLGYRTAFA